MFDPSLVKYGKGAPRMNHLCLNRNISQFKVNRIEKGQKFLIAKVLNLIRKATFIRQFIGKLYKGDSDCKTCSKVRKEICCMPKKEYERLKWLEKNVKNKFKKSEPEHGPKEINLSLNCKGEDSKKNDFENAIADCLTKIKAEKQILECEKKQLELEELSISYERCSLIGKRKNLEDARNLLQNERETLLDEVGKLLSKYDLEMYQTEGKKKETEDKQKMKCS